MKVNELGIEERRTNGVLVMKTERKRAAGRTRLSLDNIEVDLKGNKMEGRGQD
jgi:hypothetical protein